MIVESECLVNLYICGLFFLKIFNKYRKIGFFLIFFFGGDC